MDSLSFAVAIKSVFDKSKGRPRYASVKAWFCSGSRTSRNAEVGSLRPFRPNLSSSSGLR